MFSFETLFMLIIGLFIGLSLGIGLQYYLAVQQRRRNRIAAYREKWRYHSDLELESIVHNGDNFMPEQRQAAEQLLMERKQLIS